MGRLPWRMRQRKASMASHREGVCEEHWVVCFCLFFQLLKTWRVGLLPHRLFLKDNCQPSVPLQRNPSQLPGISADSEGWERSGLQLSAGALQLPMPLTGVAASAGSTMSLSWGFRGRTGASGRRCACCCSFISDITTGTSQGASPSPPDTSQS